MIDLFYIDTLKTLTVNENDINIESMKDQQISKVMIALIKSRKLNAKDTWNINPNEFSIEQNLIFRQHRIVIPEKFREKILKELHIGHFGIINKRLSSRILMVVQHK